MCFTIDQAILLFSREIILVFFFFFLYFPTTQKQNRVHVHCQYRPEIVFVSSRSYRYPIYLILCNTLAYTPELYPKIVSDVQNERTRVNASACNTSQYTHLIIGAFARQTSTTSNETLSASNIQPSVIFTGNSANAINCQD